MLKHLNLSQLGPEEVRNPNDSCIRNPNQKIPVIRRLSSSDGIREAEQAALEADSAGL